MATAIILAALIIAEAMGAQWSTDERYLLVAVVWVFITYDVIRLFR